MKNNPAMQLSALTCVILTGCISTTDNTSRKILVTAAPAITAPMGYQWQVNQLLSDDFNGETLDTTKWADQIKTWKGRRPAEFLANNVSISNGNLALKTSTHPKPNDGFTIGGAAVTSLNTKTYGYFEAKIKASKTKMSTTFWLNTVKSFNNPSATGCASKHQSEIDILEAIGGWPTSNWANVMHSNTHYKTSVEKDGKCRGGDYLSQGASYDAGVPLADNYHTYAAWWVNPNTVHYYFDGKKVNTVFVDHYEDGVPFNDPMSLRMVAETYDWQKKAIKKVAGDNEPYPTVAELNDNSINAAYYDYVHSYDLIPSANNLIVNPDFENAVTPQQWQFIKTELTQQAYDAYTHAWAIKVPVTGLASQTVNVEKNTEYHFNVYAKNTDLGPGAQVQIQDLNGKKIASLGIRTKFFEEFELSFNSANNSQIVVAIVGAKDALGKNYKEGQLISNTILDTFSLMKKH